MRRDVSNNIVAERLTLRIAAFCVANTLRASRNPRDFWRPRAWQYLGECARGPADLREAQLRGFPHSRRRRADLPGGPPTAMIEYLHRKLERRHGPPKLAASPLSRQVV